METLRIFITGYGVISAAGSGKGKTLNALAGMKTKIAPISLFPVSSDPPLPVGQIPESLEHKNIPRTHAIALHCAKEAMSGVGHPPDAIILGVTTGGILTTEELLKRKEKNPESFRLHGAGTVSCAVAELTGCAGPALTVSTACSSGALAIKIAIELILTKKAKTVLAGGVDSLSRLTYYGFNSLQLIDPNGSHPLDKDRLGMSVAEGGALLLLEAAAQVPNNAVAEICGGGLSCDAYHATAPHPDGLGALSAMKAAIRQSGLEPEQIDYINLHGTGTINNDLAECKAIQTLFKGKLPAFSSTKGIFGHSLAGAGAIEAVIAALCMENDSIAPNVGFTNIDPAIGVTPQIDPKKQEVGAVLSNSLGFGGNNASLLFRKPKPNLAGLTVRQSNYLGIKKAACLTGAGNLDASLENIAHGNDCRGIFDTKEISKNLPKKFIRRLRRLPLMVLYISEFLAREVTEDKKPNSVFFGTGWGPLSETYNFLKKLFDSKEQFSSPIDFAGSVHNAPASQAAMLLGAKGLNVTATGGDASFEQALLMAQTLLLPDDSPALVIGADEAHGQFSPLFDASVRQEGEISDGAGGLLLTPNPDESETRIRVAHYGPADFTGQDIERMIEAICVNKTFSKKFGAIFVGIPAVEKESAQNQMVQILKQTDFNGPVIDYRKWFGQFASASAVAAVVAARCAMESNIPAGLVDGKNVLLKGQGILVIGLGKFLSAIEIL